MSSSSTTQCNPQDLVNRIQGGDADAENDFVAQYGRGVLFILRREARDEDTVLDLYQDTFRIAIEKIRKGDLREADKVGSFLASTARFVVIGHYRAQARHDKRFESAEDENYAAPDDSQLQSMMRQETSELVRQTIGELKGERDRQILYRFYIAEDDKEDICRDLDLSSLHFNRVLHRAKQRYKELFIKVSAKKGHYA